MDVELPDFQKYLYRKKDLLRLPLYLRLTPRKLWSMALQPFRRQKTLGGDLPHHGTARGERLDPGFLVNVERSTHLVTDPEVQITVSVTLVLREVEIIAYLSTCLRDLLAVKVCTGATGEDRERGCMEDLGWFSLTAAVLLETEDPSPTLESLLIASRSAP